MPKILIVEDEATNRDMIMRRLAWEGYAVAIAVNGSQSIALAQADAPDLILMDLGLPGLSGWDAARTLKAQPETNTIPIIALSAYTLRSERDQAAQAGCDAFVAKPIDFAVLLTLIAQLLSAKQRTA